MLRRQKYIVLGVILLKRQANSIVYGGRNNDTHVSFLYLPGGFDRRGRKRAQSETR